jgi:hypothetical protein
MKTNVINPHNIKTAELVIGIPSYNEADSIAYPTDVVSRGLVEFFPDKKSVIINVDNNSPDGTKDAFLNTPTEIPKIYITTEKGVKGKGNNFLNLFKAAVELNAKAIIVVDADLKSITTEWVRYLGEPLFAGVDYITPIYVRHKYDGTITNHISYPLLRTLFGLRVRQPIGGDFGFSGKLARAFLSEKLWNDKIANFGIDIWMTTIAIARRFNVSQAFLGTPKIHRVKDPSKHLSKMFIEVVSTLFDLMIDFEYFWKAINKSYPSSIYGFGLGVDGKAPEVNVDTDKLFNSFKEGYEKYNKLWQEIMPTPEFNEVHKLLKFKKKEKFYYPSWLWARILFNFAIRYRDLKTEEEKEELMSSFIPFYHSRILSFVNKTIKMDIKDAEDYLENITRVFEKEKYYLIERWDECKRKKGGMFFY